MESRREHKGRPRGQGLCMFVLPDPRENTMEETTDKVALITGASSGIGEALAREYALRGWQTVLVARRTQRLIPLARALGRSLAVAGDVTRDGDMEQAVARARETFGRLDVVVANAGFGVNGAVLDLTLDDYRRQFETNVFGVLRTARATLPALLETGGVFAVVGSVSGYLATPGTVPYAMSKYAVRAWCEGARAELASRGVAVVHIAPGFVESEIRRVDRRGTFHENHRDPVPAWIQMSAAQAAREICDAIERREPERVLTRHGRLGVWLSRRAPGLLREVFRLAARKGVRITKPEV